MVTRTWPVLQSFEKDLTKIVFTINQISGGLTQIASGSTIIPGLREPLTANRIYYVSNNSSGGVLGSNSNNGLSPTIGTAPTGPFLTIQKAIDVAFGNLDLKGFNVTIQVADGTYNEQLTVIAPQVGAGRIIINGNATTPSNVVLTSAGVTVQVLRNALFAVGNVKIQSTAGYCMFSSLSGILQIQAPIVFGVATGGAHMYGSFYGTIDTQGVAYTIDGNANYHMLANNNGTVRMTGSAVTFTAARAFAAFGYASNVSYLEAYSTGFGPAGFVTGTTGLKYDVSNNAVFSTAGLTMPGGTAGSATFGGIYN